MKLTVIPFLRDAPLRSGRRHDLRPLSAYGSRIRGLSGLLSDGYAAATEAQQAHETATEEPNSGWQRNRVVVQVAVRIERPVAKQIDLRLRGLRPVTSDTVERLGGGRRSHERLRLVDARAGV